MVSISNSFRFREADLNVIGSLHFLLPLFESSFGREYTLGEPCEIYNDSKSSCPELQICYQPIRIRLSLDKTGYWNQLIFQLSHELCHYVLRQYRLNTFYSNACLSWYEEITCTAFSWCALKYAAVNWHNCVLSKQCPDYSQYMSSYLTHELGKPCNHCFSCCNTIDQLLDYEHNRQAESDRYSQRTEIRTLYDALVPDYASAKVLGNYYKYMRSNGVTIDFNQWMEHESSPLLAVLEYIQPVKDTDN